MPCPGLYHFDTNSDNNDIEFILVKRLGVVGAGRESTQHETGEIGFAHPARGPPRFDLTSVAGHDFFARTMNVIIFRYFLGCRALL